MGVCFVCQNHVYSRRAWHEEEPSHDQYLNFSIFSYDDSSFLRFFRVCIFSVRRRNARYGLFGVMLPRFSVFTYSIKGCCWNGIGRRDTF